MDYKTLQEKASALGKQLLIESVSYIPKSVDVEIFDDKRLVEDTTGKKYECRGILKNVPVTRYTENYNGRIYSKTLWENVRSNNMFEGADCLANHAEDDGSVLDTVGVWHNFVVNEDTGNADLYCIGEGGSLLLEKAKAGGKVGFSTVGFGEFKEDGKSVQEDSFELSNCDWVRNPSQNVYGTSENIVREDSDIKNKSFENLYTNINEGSLKDIKNNNENTERGNNMSEKVNEQILKNQMKSIIKEAKSNDNFKDALSLLKEAYNDIPQLESPVLLSLKQEIENEIEALTEKVGSELNATKVSLKEKEESLVSYKEKYEKVKEDYNKVKNILDTYKGTLEEDTHKMLEDIEVLTEDRENMLSDIEIFEEEREAMQEDIEIFEEQLSSMQEDINKMLEDRKLMLEDIEEAQKIIDKTKKESANRLSHIKKLEKIMTEEYGYDFDDETYIDDDEIIDYEEPMDDYEDDFIEEPIDYIDDEDNFIDEYDDDFYESGKVKPYNFQEACKKGGKKKEPVKSPLKEKKVVNIDKIVADYFQEAVKETPSISKIKNDVLSSKSLYEATKVVEVFRNRKDSGIFKVSESDDMNKQTEIKPYVFKRS